MIIHTWLSGGDIKTLDAGVPFSGIFDEKWKDKGLIKDEEFYPPASKIESAKNPLLGGLRPIPMFWCGRGGIFWGKKTKSSEKCHGRIIEKSVYTNSLICPTMINNKNINIQKVKGTAIKYVNKHAMLFCKSRCPSCNFIKKRESLKNTEFILNIKVRLSL